MIRLGLIRLGSIRVRVGCGMNKGVLETKENKEQREEGIGRIHKREQERRQELGSVEEIKNGNTTTDKTSRSGSG